MKATPRFREVIEEYLVNRSKTDELFAVSFAKPDKKIDDCITYILNTVHKSGCNGFSDEEIFSMAVHYYDEDKIDIGKTVNATVVINRTIELTEEEKRQAKEDALKRATDEAYQAIIKKNNHKPASSHSEVKQVSLF